MNNDLLISIIVPVYNTEKYLSKCIESIIAQTYKNIEIILIDDGSFDASAKICDEYAKIDNRIVVIHQKQSGVSAARNAGLRIAKGNYIGFVDSDDWVSQNMYEILLKNILENNADVSVISCCVDTKETIGKESGSKDIICFSNVDSIREMLVGTRFQGHMCTKLYKSQLYKNKVFDEKITIAEDLLMNISIFTEVKKVIFQDFQLYHYLQRENSALHVVEDSHFSFQYAFDLMSKIISNNCSVNSVYVERASIESNVLFASQVADENVLTREYYLKIKNHMNKYISDESMKNLDKKIIIWLITFYVGRFNFIIMRKLYGLYRMVKTIVIKANSK